MLRSYLLCTFTTLDKLPSCISYIHKSYYNDVANLKCFQYIQTPSSVICVYNVEDSSHRIKDTISINRKKETLTFYSINALNNIIRAFNGGVLDKSFRVDWELFRSSLIVADGEAYKKIEIKELN